MDVEAHHNRRVLAATVFFAGRLLNLETIPLKANHAILERELAPVNEIESFPAHPANNVDKSIRRRLPALRDGEIGSHADRCVPVFLHLHRLWSDVASRS